MRIDSFHPLVLNVGKAVHNADWNWQNVCSPFARIYYVVAGEAEFDMNGRRYKLRPGNMYLIPPFATHTTQCTGRFVHYYIHIYEEDMSGSAMFEENDFPVEIMSQRDDEGLFERLAALNPFMTLEQSNPESYDNNKTLVQSIIYNKQRPEWLKMESRGIIYQLCARFVADAKAKSFTKDKRVLRTIRLIHERLSEHISVDQLAHEADLSPEHYIRLFCKVIGVTPMLYINHKRIEKAQLLLLTTESSVKEVAQTLGFTDNSYFVRVFKRVTGITPSEYRRQSPKQPARS